MSRYSNFYKPYVPVAQRRLDGHKAVEKLRKKGVVIEPLGELSHRTKIATSFWGSAWCKHLESFSDYENRLPRGRTYVRNGSVLHLAILPGEVKALVQGSELYEETITITPMDKKKWQAIQNKCKGRVGSLIELLQGRISDEIMRVVTDPEDGLFPKLSQIKLNCNCPDWATMCKHVAAVLYGIGARLDSQPELLFKLRGVDHNDLISAAVDGSAFGASAGGRSGGRRRTLDSAALGDVFGIDLDEATPVPESKPKRPVKAKKVTKKASGKTPKKVAKKVLKKVRAFKATSAAIRKLRAGLGISRAEFAGLVGVSVPSIVNWETKGGALNIRAASFERLQQIANQTAARK